MSPSTSLSQAVAKWSPLSRPCLGITSATWRRARRWSACLYAAWGNRWIPQADGCCCGLGMSERAEGHLWSCTGGYDCARRQACLRPKLCRRMTWVARARAGPPKGVITAEGEMREVLKGRKREGGIEAGGRGQGEWERHKISHISSQNKPSLIYIELW